MAGVEQNWFRLRMAGQDVPWLFRSEAEPNGDFDGAVLDAEVVAAAWEACHLAPAARRSAPAHHPEAFSAADDESLVHPDVCWRQESVLHGGSVLSHPAFGVQWPAMTSGAPRRQTR